MPDIVWIWLATFVVLLIIEIFIPSMLFIGFALAALVSGIYSYFAPESYYVQIGVFIVVSAILLPLTRKMAKKITKDSPQTASVDALIGKIGTVIKTIEPNTAGQLKLDSETWRAISEEKIELNEKAKVFKIVGATVHVEKVD